MRALVHQTARLVADLVASNITTPLTTTGHSQSRSKATLEFPRMGLIEDVRNEGNGQQGVSQSRKELPMNRREVFSALGMGVGGVALLDQQKHGPRNRTTTTTSCMAICLKACSELRERLQ